MPALRSFIRRQRLVRRSRGLFFEPLENRTLLAAIITVNTTDDGDVRDAVLSLREAIQINNRTLAVASLTAGEQAQVSGTPTSADADTITFSSLFNTPQTITLGGTQLTIAEALTILGPGANRLTVSGNTASRVFNVDDSTASQIFVTLDGLTISGGRDVSGGGGISNIESLTISNSTISGNDGTDFASGGGVLSGNNVASSTLTISNSTISGNMAAFGGGVVCGGSTCTIINSTISGNMAGGQGGGVYEFSTTFTVTNSTISGNGAGNGVGGVFIQSGTATISNSTITNNSADADGNGSAAGGGGNPHPLECHDADQHHRRQ